MQLRYVGERISFMVFNDELHSELLQKSSSIQFSCIRAIKLHDCSAWRVGECLASVKKSNKILCRI